MGVEQKKDGCCGEKKVEQKKVDYNQDCCECCPCHVCYCRPCTCCMCDPCHCPKKKVEQKKDGCCGPKKVEQKKDGCCGSKKDDTVTVPVKITEYPEITIKVGDKKITIKIEDFINNENPTKSSW